MLFVIMMLDAIHIIYVSMMLEVAECNNGVTYTSTQMERMRAQASRDPPPLQPPRATSETIYLCMTITYWLRVQPTEHICDKSNLWDQMSTWDEWQR